MFILSSYLHKCVNRSLYSLVEWQNLKVKTRSTVIFISLFQDIYHNLGEISVTMQEWEHNRISTQKNAKLQAAAAFTRTALSYNEKSFVYNWLLILSSIINILLSLLFLIINIATIILLTLGCFYTFQILNLWWKLTTL